MNPAPVILSQLLKSYFKRHMALNSSIELRPYADTNRRYFLYAHIPFCEYLCSFCPFHRVKFRLDKANRYFRSLNRELDFYGDHGFVFSDLYVGGGTPTILIDELCSFIGNVRKLHPINNISVETNPNHLTDSKIDKLLACGVKRLSVGVQSLSDNILRDIGRLEPYGSREEIIGRLSQAAGRFETLNVDLICNFPSQTVASVLSDLEVLSTLNIDQITVYPLMPVKSSGKFLRDRYLEAGFNREADYYQAIYNYLLPQYTASTAWCFSRKASAIDEYIVAYDEYVGMGSGAFGFINGVFYSNTFSINNYNKLVSRGYPGITANRLLSLKEQAQYDFLVKLFSGKLDKSYLVEKYGSHYRALLTKEILFFKLVGAISESEATFHLTNIGRRYWIKMMKEFLVSVNVFRGMMRDNIREELALIPV